MTTPPDPSTASPLPTPMGLLIVDKPLHRTSMDVCRWVRSRLRRGGAPKRIKVGHGGTLDPLATGVVVVLIGKATPLCDAIMRGQKEYQATIDLARTSTTDDLEGEITEHAVDPPPTRAQLESACASFVGDIMQTPPIYSAIKVNGRRAYALARKGETPKLDPRPVRIDAIELVGYHWPIATVQIVCGKGTYIRSLARDLGHAIGGGGMLTALRRTRVGRFTLDGAIQLDDLPDPMLQEHLLAIPADLDHPKE